MGGGWGGVGVGGDRDTTLRGSGLQRVQSHSPTPSHFPSALSGDKELLSAVPMEEAGVGGGLGGGFSPVGCVCREMTILYTSV